MSINHVKQYFILTCLLIGSQLYSQEYARISDSILILDNGNIRREIKFSKQRGKIYSSSLTLAGDKNEFLSWNSEEFNFSVNDKHYDGQQLWKVISCSAAKDINHGKGASINIRSEQNPDFEADITYLLYPNLPVIRKNISFKNTGSKEIKIEAIDIENLFVNFSFPECWVMSDYGRQKRLWPYIGNWDDPAVVLHHTTSHRGILLGNEMPGVLKRTAFTDTRSRILIGTTHTDQDFVFRKWLKPGETWSTPQVFIIPYNNTDDPSDVMNGPLNDFVRKNMGIRLAQIKEKPSVIYNMGIPTTRSSDSIAFKLTDLAADCGMEIFSMDAGWHINKNQGKDYASWAESCGDWIVNKNEFPNGLKPVFDYARSKGMKPGLWISIATSNQTAQMFTDHPEWQIIDQNGNPANLHCAGDAFKTECLCTGYYDYIKNTISKIVKEYGLYYVKIDISMVTSAYIDDPKVSGCYAKNHQHKDHEESLIMIYERCFKLFDELHASFPNLFIDCTFETEGKLQMIDYAFEKHAEGNWLSNIETAFPTGGLRVRDFAWNRSAAIPAGSFLVGNLTIDDPHFEYYIKSNLGSMPMLLGDLSRIDKANIAVIKKWTSWTKLMQSKYNFILYRQDLPGYGEPREGFWDGFARINTDTKDGGIIGIFRQGGGEKSRMVFVKGLSPDKTYVVKEAPEGKEIIRMSGKDFLEKGFNVTIDQKYDGRIFEIEILK
jgi:alpha-galactosidase